MSTATDNITTDFNFRTKGGYKRPTVSVEHPIPSAAGVIEILNGDDEKTKQYVLELIASGVVGTIKGYVDADGEFDQAKMDELVANGKVSIEAIAHMPKAERNVLSKSDLEDFATDYIAVMPELTGKSEVKVKAAAGLFVEKFKRVAGDNDVLRVLKEQLGVFVEGAGEELVEKHEKALTYFFTKLDELLDAKVTADAL